MGIAVPLVLQIVLQMEENGAVTISMVLMPVLIQRVRAGQAVIMITKISCPILAHVAKFVTETRLRIRSLPVLPVAGNARRQQQQKPAQARDAPTMK
jgi:hypothetical protein